ncbi:MULTISPECIES: hypothetical protein [unclassified Ruegeria]|uniref:hypothetical protein n=1 Tax=unclassified Ruegeria TaxID=2625375 RepID=UPI0014880EDE|nr:MULTISPECIES: hypothetical protein [unclassified Ruegeria]NOD36941.1 hypothetical protein [Ruegeria sp. HKCCD7296]NOD48086.1 hypothetical protein [Ruegeria sp. HKCCD5849]NOD53447.1 hypothetical protein [Ruegeria sp. HKCCD5851]NOD70075.1 hypothetical protein [Ruegeria sp. HKCCD7303]NOE35886.1 hypothetical protein [Ruegeria sp. HKCCD7318]
MKKLVVLGVLVALAACDETPPETPETGAAPAPTNDDLRLVGGYRSEDDWCQLTGETGFTVEFLDHTADLVSCPTGSAAAQSLVDDLGAVQVAETGGYTVYTIQRE